jgi:endonuclease/exonuclease/phosphatase family metal-dependent hydrolase
MISDNLSDMEISVLSINLAGIQFGWFEERRKALLTQTKKLSPDIVFLQETTVVPSRLYDQTLDLQAELGLNASAFVPYGNPEEYDSPKLSGIGILSRWPFMFSQGRKLPGSVRDQYGSRAGLFCKINVNGKDILLATTHLAYRPEEEKLRLHQALEFLRTLYFYQKERIIFGGDFNAEVSESGIQEILKTFIDSGNKEVTWSEKNEFIRSRKNRRLDYLFTSKDLDAINSEVVLNEKTPVFPSDHFAVLARYDV